jgi:superfamily II DNA or RNA helicase/diadenosine tetraphosphate (Ap4A) HIT family hydrolase
MDNTPAVPAQKRDCPFCEMAQERIVFETEVIRALWDLYPATPGHALLIPKRHVENWFLASEHEQQALMLSIDRLRREIEKRYCPDGFNIGINVGPAAGQTVFHLHVHVIPRYLGDVRYPQGGVRHVIPSKAVYGTMSRETLLLRDQPSKERSLVSGDADPLLPHLCADFDKAYRIDIAVAFILKSGVSLIQEHLRDLLDRGGTIRVLTGDYLDVTDPQALRMLSDLGDGIQQRVFDASTQSFHPKAFIVYFPEGGGVAYVGSSNLSESALNRGVEWNYKVIPFSEQNGFVDVVEAFEKLYHHPKTAQVDDSWLAKYEARRQKRQNPELAVPTEMPDEIPHPHSVQEEALRALAISRQQGHQAGLVVLATGLGKTWLSAFDTFRSGLKKILFVAHREEILNQSISTFRRIHQNKSFGRYDGNQKRRDVDVLFGSIQTLGRIKHLDSFARDAFDYIVIDEFHHAAARTYRNLIDYFDPQFLLGLTATPERSDGGDLMALCQDNLIYRKDLFDGIEAGLLSVFDYFGVPDEVDYANIPWRNSRFDERALTDAVATQKRAENVMEHYREKAGQRALGFCCSTLHADFMAKYFQKHGVRAVAVHSGPNSHPRAASLDRLREGGLEIVFAVDMFNEGVDIPSIDTVMMLRPTESVIIWLQQFGRGLRKAKNKSKLKVIDYIGNHRTFLTKVRALFHLGLGEGEIEQVLNLLAGQGTGDDQERLAKLLPSGCDVTYDMQSIEILRSLLKPTKNIDLFESYYLDFKFRLGQRPTARQAFRDGFNPSSLKIAYDTWFSFVQAQGGMDGIQKQVVDNYRLFLKELETTRMTKSYKMVLLLAMLREDCLPGGVAWSNWLKVSSEL